MPIKLSPVVNLSKGIREFQILFTDKEVGRYAGVDSLDEILKVQAEAIAEMPKSKGAETTAAAPRIRRIKRAR